jgi:hypothetical protein
MMPRRMVKGLAWYFVIGAFAALAIKLLLFVLG